ncbi:unnamed protein product [Heligmosomoides polygyrus]|uniref:C-type lectin domain-containing protein n=1 Tax=Heligmosomoides polygyrus TaxID=6339 RepID=A0A3P8CHW1_HELPZ|nr:unnamed protein product [Heligmosomoides polygyrus]
MSAVLIFLITMDWTVIVAATRTSKEEYAAGASSAWLPLFKEGLCVRKYNGRLTFDQAEESCVKAGGHLATICNEEDNVLLS